MNTTDIKTIVRKIGRAKDKDAMWNKFDLNRKDALAVVRTMVLSVPKGCYRLHNRECGTNLVDTVWSMYGWMPSMWIDEPMMLGLSILYPDKVYASFTHGLGAIEIK